MDEPTWLHLGLDCYVRAAEVVSIHDGAKPPALPMRMFLAGHLRAVVFLRDGSAVPAYLDARQLIAQLGGAARPLTSELRGAIGRAYQRGYAARRRREGAGDEPAGDGAPLTADEVAGGAA